MATVSQRLFYYTSQAASANTKIKRITSKNKERERERERERAVSGKMALSVWSQAALLVRQT